MAQQIVTTSKRFNLTAPDWVKALAVAVLSPIVPIIMQSLSNGSLTFDWKLIGTTALSAGVAYLAKNFLSPGETRITGVPAPGATTTVVIPPKEEVKAGVAKPTITETPKQ